MASMQAVQPRVGYADLERMPDDGRRYEIHGGELVVVPSPRVRHQVVVGAIFRILDTYARGNGGTALVAPLDIVFDELLSPSTAAVDRGRKRRTFARYGVPEYWIVDPRARQIEVHVLDGGDYRVTQVASGAATVRSALLPDLTFEAARTFERP